MSLSKEEILKAAYDAGLFTLSAVSVGFASKKTDLEFRHH